MSLITPAMCRSRTFHSCINNFLKHKYVWGPGGFEQMPVLSITWSMKWMSLWEQFLRIKWRDKVWSLPYLPYLIKGTWMTPLVLLFLFCGTRCLISVNKGRFLKTSCVQDPSMSIVYMSGFVYKCSLRFLHVTLNNSLSDVLSSVWLHKEENQTISLRSR